ncbi:Pycsar system effector family protein [Winogradskyella sp. UBA3174]|uniref:Pycsar system effector family protein n=1 Tax=Winogradskyella sp. UBA3174 TaxID=1947785 RepID=UPI0025D8F5AE|nr:Pycsar system effector family protein [Winogradskyella sp. UBA3174]|tara:strand:+ start:28013 stop:28519 length:507 start_codon:yes stop_codon:yes gene_type:complete
MAQDPNNYWEQLERLEKLIRASELKAGIVFSFHSLILGLFADRIERFREVFVDNTVLLILLVCWLTLVAISIFYCFRCFKPQIELSYNKNVFFFRDAVNKFGDTDQYTTELIKVCGSEKELYKLLAEQIHTESKIINLKFKNVRKSILFFALSFLFIILTTLYWILFA